MLKNTTEYQFGIKQYSYKNLFNNIDKNYIVNYLENNFFECDKLNCTAPGYQTTYQINLFDILDPQFIKLKQTFIESVYDYTNQLHIKERIRLQNYSSFCWCYLNWKNSDRSHQPFHIHNESNPESMTGIFYLKLPKRRKNINFETEFYLGCNKFNLPSIESSWFIFPSNFGHIPGKQEIDQKRYVISADIYFPS